MNTRGFTTACVLIAVTCGAYPALGQNSRTFAGISFSEPYSANSFGVDARWSTADARWSISGFGSALNVGEYASDAWLLEFLVTRALGATGFRNHIIFSTGFRVSGQRHGFPTEFATPVLMGARIPIVVRGTWDVELEAQFGLVRRHARGETVLARANRFGLALGLGQMRISFGHDDAARSSTPFNYGGATRLSVGWRF